VRDVREDAAAQARARNASRVVTLLRPGQKGTKKLLERFGSQLLCVRHRRDELTRTRLVTVEVVVSERSAGPIARKRHELVGVAVRKGEADLAARLRRAGGRWSPEARQWQVPLEKALALGLRRRIRQLKLPTAARPTPRKATASTNPPDSCIQ
jgi:hypothetical protein